MLAVQDPVPPATTALLHRRARRLIPVVDLTYSVPMGQGCLLLSMSSFTLSLTTVTFSPVLPKLYAHSDHIV